MTEKDLDIAIEKCERIMEVDTRTMQNPVSENGWIFEKVYELLQYLRQFQFATDTNVATTDTISRQAALDVLHGYFDGMLETDTVCPKDLYNEIEALPSAQPVEDARAMCGECDAWNKYKNYPQPEQFNPCTVCQEFDCTGCKFRRI